MANFNLQSLANVALVFVIVVVALAFGMNLNSNLRTSQNPCGSGYTYTQSATFPDGRCCISTNVSGCAAADMAQAYNNFGNVTAQGDAALSIFTGKIGLLALAVVLGIVVSVLFGLFMSRRK